MHRSTFVVEKRVKEWAGNAALGDGGVEDDGGGLMAHAGVYWLESL